MPTSPHPSPPQSPVTETANDHPLIVAAELPAQPQGGTLSDSATPGGLEQSPIESLLDAFDRDSIRSMPENTTRISPPSSPTLPRAANTQARPRTAHHPIRIVPDPPRPGQTGNQNQQNLSLPGRVLVFLGYGRGNRARKELVSVIFSVVIDASQIIAIITLLAISTHRKSPLEPTKNEWDACGKPLGTWDALWAVRVALDIWLSVWRWSRERTKRLQDESNGHASNDAERQSRSRANAAPPGGRTHSGAQRNTNASNDGQSPAGPASYPRIYARLSLMGSTFALVWFVLVQILLYGSTGTCRRTSPHLWWLTFGLLSVMYVMILEVIVVAILVFVVGPILFLFWSILLLCLGRHPSQNPHHFTPDIGQVPRAVVDRLPLVLYIPPQPGRPPKPVTLPSDLHTYPPKSSTPRRGLRLPFRRRGASTSDTVKGRSGKEKKDPSRPRTWEDNWEKGEYPFVQLDSHRASCAICLVDFEEPKRVDATAPAPAPGPDATKVTVSVGTEVAVSTGTGAQQPVESDVTEHADTGAPASPTGETLRLQDAGQGAQPLRLLKCGHVFHKTCVDPWLLDVSGRCPVCQRPVREQADAIETEVDTRPARRRWFRRSRRRGPA